jgi:hypothetical protein
MKIDFTKADSLLARSDMLYNIAGILVVALFVLLGGLFVAGTTSDRFRSFVDRTWYAFVFLIVGLLLSGLAVAVFATFANGDYRNAVNKAIAQAAEETYGLKLSDTEVVKVAGSFISTNYGVEGMPASKELTLYGSTKVLAGDNQLIDITLIARNGEYQIVGGEGVYVELPKVD